ncbi:MAG: DUF4258 domain-containing protein [Actinomycetota bacterium]
MERAVRYSLHALERMAQRNIHDSEVREALANQTRETGGARGTIIRFGTTKTGRRLKIIQPVDDPGFIITVAASGEGP